MAVLDAEGGFEAVQGGEGGSFGREGAEISPRRETRRGDGGGVEGYDSDDVWPRQICRASASMAIS